MLHIINDILDLFKLEANKIDLELTNFNLLSCIESIISVLHLQAQDNNIEFTLDIDLDNTWFCGDETRLRQILFNLIGNAIKFTKDGEIKIVARSKPLDTESCELYIAIEDQGIGISQSGKEKLFKAFSQADASSTRKYGGTGLGLSICKKLVTLMHCDIWVESRLGLGSKFKFTINLQYGHEPLPEDVSEPVTHQQTVHSPLTILLVEDNEINRMVAEAMLENLGYTCDIAKDSLQAIDAVKRQNYDLILMDCQMPNMDGYEATQHIRKLFNGAVQPTIIALTANVFKSDIDRCYSVGMDGVLSKPMQINDLKKILSEQFPDKSNRLIS